MILISLLVLKAFCQQIPEDAKSLKIGQTINGFISPLIQGHQLYELNIPPLTQRNLIVMVKGSNPNSDPNIYISKKIQAPLSVEDADILACEAEGLDICTIKYQQVNEESLLYIAVVSEFPVSYSLRIDFEKEIQLVQNDFLTLIMTQESQIQIIDFKLGQIHQDSTEIEVIVQVVNQEQLEEPIFVYMNYKENGIPSNTKFDFEGKDTWNNAKVIEFKQQKPNEEFIILIEAEQGAKIWVTSEYSSEKKQLFSHSSVYQVVKKGEIDFYETPIYIFEECDYAFTLIPFQGAAKMYINLGAQPPLLDNYEWKDQVKQGYQILITYQELKQKNIQFSSTFYLAIFGEEYCTYKLNFHCWAPSQDVFIDPQTQYFRHINHSEILSFRIFESYKQAIVLKIQLFQGELIFLVTDCDYQECSKNMALFDTYQELSNKLKKNFTLIQPTHQNFEFVLNCEQFCDWRIIAQLNESSSQNQGYFSIRFYKPEDVLILQENTPHKSTVSKLEEKYYKFFISEDDQIERLSVLLTTIEGKATIFVSTSNQRPQQDNYEFKSTNNSINLGGEYENDPKPGTYYITVIGDSECKFIITIWVVRNVEDQRQYGKFSWHYIQLYQGDPQEQHIQSDQIALFKIDLLSYFQSYKRSIQVKLQAIQGNIEMLGFIRPEDDEEKYLWKSSSIIQIDEDDEIYPEILYLRIRTQQFCEFASFRITYHYKNDYISLYENQQYFNFIEENEQQQFSYYFNPGNKFMITKRSEDTNQKNLQFKFENIDGLGFSFSENNNSVLVKHNGIDIMCMKFYCQSSIYFFLKSFTDQFYSIIISKIDQNEILLIDGQTVTKTVPTIEDNFYFYAEIKQLSIISISISAKLSVYAYIFPNNTSERKYPNQTNFDKVSKTHKIRSQNTLQISQADLERQNCSKLCLVLLTVFNNEKYNTPENSFFEYSISFSQHVNPLRQEESQIGFVYRNSFQYYIIRIPESQNQTNLMILLNSVDQCNPNLYISKNTLPLEKQNQWRAEKYYGDIIVIESGNRIDPNMSGQYYLGVTAKSDCQFIIQYRLGNFKLFDIVYNVPVSIYIKEDEIMYFMQSIFEKQKKFTIFFESPSNTARFFVDEFDEYGYGEINQDITKFKHNNNNQGYNEFLTLRNEFPDLIFFIIAVKAYISEKITIQISDNDEQIILYAQKKYNFYLTTGENRILSIHPQSEKILLNILPGSDSLSAEYCYKNNYQAEQGTETFNALIIKDSIQNQFTIDRIQNQYIQLHLKNQANEIRFKLWYIELGFIQQRNIQSTIPELILIDSLEQETLIFTSQNPNITKKIISVTLQLSELFKMLSQKQKFIKPDVILYSRSTKQQLSHSYEAEVSDLIYREYSDTEQEYEIRITNNMNLRQGYFLQVCTSDLRPLILDFKQFGLTQLHESNYYFYSIPHSRVKSLLFYQMHFCDGLYQVVIAKDLNKLKDGIYDNQIEIKQNKSNYGFINLNDLIFYMKIQMYKSFKEEDNQGKFTIKVNLVDSITSIPYDKIYPGNQGKLIYDFESSNEENMINLIVNYSPLNYSSVEKDTDFSILKVEYFLLQYESEIDDPDFDYCIQTQSSLQFIDTQQNNFENLVARVLIYQQSGSFLFTIQAKVYVVLSIYQQITLDYYYEPNFVKRENNFNLQLYRDWQNYKVVSLIIGALIGLLVLLFLLKQRIKNNRLHCKQSQNQQSQGLEMQFREISVDSQQS